VVLPVHPEVLSELTEEDVDRTLAVNVKGTVFALQESARCLRDGGRIITISTVNTVLFGPGIGLYAASKAALEQLTRIAALELSERGITANIVSPVATDTELFHGANPPRAAAEVAGQTPLGRWHEETVAAASVRCSTLPSAPAGRFTAHAC
jgi:3-oxoacyl-[acyl-carrier protein] reductase